MATISSHVLDSIIGDHAKQIRIEFFRTSADGERTQLFNVIANDEGRIREEVEVSESDHGAKYELVFQSAEYFDNQPGTPPSGQIMPEIVVRFLIPDPAGKIHIPLMLSPHQYSTWWSA